MLELVVMVGIREYVGMVLPLKVLTDKEVKNKDVCVCLYVRVCVFQTSMV